MDYNTQPEQMPQQSYAGSSRSGFLIASVVCAVLALASSCVIFASMFFAGLSIVFAVLSKGGDVRLSMTGKTAVIVSAASLIFSVFLTVWSVVTVMSDPEMRQSFYEQYEEMTGISLEEEIGQLKSLYQQ